jgi:hypothetical protein
MRSTLMTMWLCALGIGLQAMQTPPKVENLPPSRRVTDPARPDVGFTPWAGSELTIVVVFAADCKPCEESIPFYARLFNAPGMDRTTRRLTLLTDGGIFPVIDLISKHPQGFKPYGASSYPQDDRFQLKTLPTVLVFDGAWKQRGRWEGRLSAVQETEVTTLVATIVAEAKKKKGAPR